VGAGASAMGLVHGLLSRFKNGTPPFTIAVLERGSGAPHASDTRTPNRWCNASHRQSQSVLLMDSLTTGKRVIDIPVGKGLGGSTNINACLCCPPTMDDSSTWPAPWNTTLNGSVGVIQENMIANNAIHLHCCDDDNPYEAATPQGSKIVSNPEREATVFPSLVTRVPLSVAKNDTGEFVRMNYFQSLVEPLFRECPQLTNSITFLGDFEVQRLLFSKDNGERVIGVEGDRKAIYARREVILCAGAIESPALLLVSGIGHEQDLKQIGIRPRRKASCTGVGRRLRDHVLVPLVFLSPWSPRVLSPNGVHALYYDCKDGNRFQFILNDAAVYSQLVPHFVASFVRRRISFPPVIKSIVNLLLNGIFRSCRNLLVILVSYTPLYFVLRYFVIIMNVALLNPKSTGTVTIRRRKSCNNREPLGRKDVTVLVDAGYLSDPQDMVALMEGWKCSMHRFAPFLSRCVEVLPGILFRGISVFGSVSTGTNWFHTFASHFALPYFHWCGTCAMETISNAEWVVDSSLRVRDTAGLRVCDASVFPTLISGPTALTCSALGHALADLLLNNSDKKNL
jgi:choline dehydrogenase-like flavoprotein